MHIITFREADGSVVNHGDTLVDFRGDEATFVSASRPMDSCRSGKVVTNREGMTWSHESYDNVFDCAAVDIDDPEAKLLVAQRYGQDSKVFEALSRAIDAQMTAELQKLLYSNPWATE
ncbi:hypothetical protein HOT81_gp071 [Gordonia phage Fryberger]|uniref:Uncharacterized protein n=1 Tax=Gordonia phage Fryberger TaxID=2250392 RepID=A0A346FCM5_9CAUD|nr:hypothetical protein HOT81_gp071 [Gordonia phage Fryberger]AXN53489.1 hypothetical protein SEA_FRYBERGER_71 [Gordonia phage Fryberger]